MKEVVTAIISIDITAPLHHGAMMSRLSITLPDDLYAMARAHAVISKTSISKAIGDLMLRRPGYGPLGESNDAIMPCAKVHPLSGFPIVEGDGRPLTSHDVRRAEDDEDVRHLEWMGPSPDEIQKSHAK